MFFAIRPHAGLLFPLLWLGLLLSPIAHSHGPGHGSSPGNPDEAPMIEIGATGISNHAELLLEVSFNGFEHELGDSPLRDSHLFFVRIRASGGIGLGEDDHAGHSGHDDGHVPGEHQEWFPHLNIDFIPVGLEGKIGDFFVSADALELSLSRDLHLSNGRGIRVRALGARFTTEIPQTEELSLIVSLTAGALGAATRQYVDHPESGFAGVYLGDAGAEVIQRLALGDAFAVSLAMGAEASAAYGHSEREALLYEWGAFSEARFDLGRYVRLFAGVAWHGSGDTGLGHSWEVLEALGGVRVSF